MPDGALAPEGGVTPEALKCLDDGELQRVQCHRDHETAGTEQREILDIETIECARQVDFAIPGTAAQKQNHISHEDHGRYKADNSEIAPRWPYP